MFPKLRPGEDVEEIPRVRNGRGAIGDSGLDRSGVAQLVHNEQLRQISVVYKLNLFMIMICMYHIFIYNR